MSATLRPGRKPGDEARFLGAWLKNPLKTGAVAPSSRFLARLMASYVDPAAEGPVIELGPGTGPVTEALINRGVRRERLVLIEYSRDFAKLLRERFPGVTVVQGDAYAVRETLSGMIGEASGPPAAFVSSLPLLTRSEAERRKLLADSLAIAQPGAPFIQFTYGGRSPVPVGSSDGINIQRSRTILWNLPPARVFVYRKG